MNRIPKQFLRELILRTLSSMWWQLRDSWLIVVLCTFFSGTMLAFVAIHLLRPLQSIPYALQFVGNTGIHEVFPLIAIASFSARLSSQIASELAVLQGTKQWTVLHVWGVSPSRIVLWHRVIAALCVAPLLCTAALPMGIVGALWIASMHFHAEMDYVWALLWANVTSKDVVVIAFKSLVSTMVVLWIAIGAGLRAQHSAQAVGYAASYAVVRGLMAVVLITVSISFLVYIVGVI